ncbi:uncharacterized protein LOC131642041 [Vicia villosa]|uniref:uncharacterized protein LOC131642041 n=1 Tax=Vicia villosa TaxID=3911 RepID=UPI00273AC8E7|nr:uncharacterized protein LOC131642041 [Vicia villosa]
MSGNQPARIRQGRETQTASATQGMGGAKGKKEVKEKKKVSTGSTSCSRGVKEVKEKKKVSTGSTSRSQGARGPDAQAQLSGVRVVVDADGSETEWDEDWYQYLYSEEFARRAE